MKFRELQREDVFHFTSSPSTEIHKKISFRKYCDISNRGTAGNPMWIKVSRRESEVVKLNVA